MAENRLAQLLEQLRNELAGAQHMDEKGRELLRALDRDIHALLERGEPDDSVIDRLQDSIDHFEVTHPRLTSVLSNILTALNNAGI